MGLEGLVGKNAARSARCALLRRRVLGMIGEGLCQKQMAGRLRISMKAVEWHIMRLREELGMRPSGLNELAVLAWRLGLVRATQRQFRAMQRGRRIWEWAVETLKVGRGRRSPSSVSGRGRGNRRGRSRSRSL
jgi:DNA-binding CsgD family transcriptional regulator